MTDRERVVNRLNKLIKAAHGESYDFVYIPVGTAKLIVKLLDNMPIVLQKGDRILIPERGGMDIERRST